MSSIRLTFPDGSSKDYPVGITGIEIAKQIGPRLAADAVAVKLDGQVVDLTRPLEKGGDFRILTFKDEDGRRVYWHSASHVMAQAVVDLFPGTRLAIGPAIEDGFYYDFDSPTTFSTDDLARIEDRMREIIAADQPFERIEVPAAEARAQFETQGEKYKVELIDELDSETLTLYRDGRFVDLCAGPHLPSTGRIGAVRLLSVAGAYWRGDERREMLQRIYGTAYPTEKEVRAHLQRLEEARRRDHRRLGRELDLFSIQEDVGPGLVLWHPKGALVREIIEDFWKKVHRRRGYVLVSTPHIGKIGLWETSGHTEWFTEEMYAPMDAGGVPYLIKPMNCPFHILIYKSHVRSYRELPIRMGELGTCYRYQRAGVLHGMLRPRGFTQDDAHIFCTPEQLVDEIIGVLDLVQYMMKTFGYDEYKMELTARDPDHLDHYVGSDEVWQQAEAALVQALDTKRLPHEVAEGEAKFYGPSIDVSLRDAIGRWWQGPTIQVDFNEPERFDVTYTDADGESKRVVMVHRTVLGSMERFVAGLVEHLAGAFPTWLAPVQAIVLPVADRHARHAVEVRDRLRAADIRAEADDRSETLNRKIRDAQNQKIPYMLVVGDREVESDQVAVRTREEGDRGPTDLSDFIAEVRAEVAQATQPPDHAPS